MRRKNCLIRRRRTLKRKIGTLTDVAIGLGVASFAIAGTSSLIGAYKK